MRFVLSSLLAFGLFAGASRADAAWVTSYTPAYGEASVPTPIATKVQPPWQTLRSNARAAAQQSCAEWTSACMSSCGCDEASCTDMTGASQIVDVQTGCYSTGDSAVCWAEATCLFEEIG